MLKDEQSLVQSYRSCMARVGRCPRVGGHLAALEHVLALRERRRQSWIPAAALAKYAPVS